MILYRYDTTTFEYVGISRASTDMENTPGYTKIPPPESIGGKIFKFNIKTNRWNTVTAPGQSISILRSHTKYRIDQITERFRNKYITLGSGQVMVYDEKYNEAIDYVAKKYPKNLKDFPYIAAEASATNESPTDISNNILLRRKDCMRINAKVEEYRLHTKLSIKTSTNKSELDSLVLGFEDLLASIKL